jgi:hypothetical protein
VDGSSLDGLGSLHVGSNETGSHAVADEMALKHRIGLAVSQGTDLTRWKRWGE